MKNKIVLLIDANEDVRDGILCKRLEAIGLLSAPRRRHGHMCPTTQHRGVEPIDDIFVSRGVKINRSGYLPFGDGPGDHRAIYADICQESLFGGEFQKIHRLPAWRLISTNHNVVEKFNKLFNERLEASNTHERIEYLRQTAGPTLTAEQIIEYEKLDNIQQNAFQYADKRCRKLRTGEVAYEPEKIQRFGLVIRLCTLIIRKRSNCKVSTSLIRRLAKKSNTLNAQDMTIEDAKLARKLARSEYSKLKPNSRELRNKWLEKLADNTAKRFGEDKAKVLRQLRQREELRDSHKRIKWARGAGFSSGTDRVVVPDADGLMIEITEKAAIEDILMNTNKEKFRQLMIQHFNRNHGVVSLELMDLQ